MKISILHATGTHTGQVTSPFFCIQIFFVLLSKSETCLEKVHCLLKVLVAAPQLLPQFCPLRPCLVLDSIVGWAVLKMCLRVWGTVPQGHSSAWEICFTLQFASWHPLICHWWPWQCPPLPVSLVSTMMHFAADCLWCLPGSIAGAGGRVRYQNGHSAVGEFLYTRLSTLNAVQFHGSGLQIHRIAHWLSEFLHREEKSLAYFKKQWAKQPLFHSSNTPDSTWKMTLTNPTHKNVNI